MKSSKNHAAWHASEALFEELAEHLVKEPGVTRSTMMGYHLPPSERIILRVY